MYHNMSVPRNLSAPERPALSPLFILRNRQRPRRGFCMTVSVFIGTSLDGFIARPDGALDFLPEGGGEPHGYNEFIATVDALVIGSKTFETVLAFPVWPYGDKRVVVLSSRPVDLSAVRGGVVEQMSGAPVEIVAKLAASGAHHLYV